MSLLSSSSSGKSVTRPPCLIQAATCPVFSVPRVFHCQAPQWFSTHFPLHFCLARLLSRVCSLMCAAALLPVAISVIVVLRNNKTSSISRALKNLQQATNQKSEITKTGSPLHLETLYRFWCWLIFHFALEHGLGKSKELDSSSLYQSDY